MDSKPRHSENSYMLGDESNQMAEIRISWDLSLKARCTDMPVGGSRWHPDSPRNRKMLRIILESCNEIYGLGTHWIAVREAKK